MTELAAAAIDVAAPVDREVITLTNRDWTLQRRETLRKAAHARRFRLLNDFEALAWSLPHLAARRPGADRRHTAGQTRR